MSHLTGGVKAKKKKCFWRGGASTLGNLVRLMLVFILKVHLTSTLPLLNFCKVLRNYEKQRCELNWLILCSNHFLGNIVNVTFRQKQNLFQILTSTLQWIKGVMLGSRDVDTGKQWPLVKSWCNYNHMRKISSPSCWNMYNPMDFLTLFRQTKPWCLCFLNCPNFNLWLLWKLWIPCYSQWLSKKGPESLGLSSLSMLRTSLQESQHQTSSESQWLRLFRRVNIKLTKWNRCACITAVTQTLLWTFR